MAAIRRILITGATGKQGGEVINALLRSPSTTPFQLVALTRKADSSKAKALAARPNVSILQGDLNECDAIFRNQPPFHGVFSVQLPLPSVKTEEAQGKALVDAAAANDVKHFVYTSAERDGPTNSDRNPTPVAHFASKFRIEEHLKKVAAKNGKMDWTIIRPVAFMENLTPNFFGRAFVTMWYQNGADRKLQLVSTHDIGILAAAAFKEQERYASQAISLATDELTPREADVIFKRSFGTNMPRTFDFLGTTIKAVLHEQLGAMFKWFVDVGFGADPSAYRKQFPEMQGFEQWLNASGSFKKRAT